MEINCKNCGSNDIVSFECQHCGTNYIPKFKPSKDHLLTNIGIIVKDPTKIIKTIYGVEPFDYQSGLRDPFK